MDGNNTKGGSTCHKSNINWHAENSDDLATTKFTFDTIVQVSYNAYTTLIDKWTASSNEMKIKREDEKIDLDNTREKAQSAKIASQTSADLLASSDVEQKPAIAEEHVKDESKKVESEAALKEKQQLVKEALKKSLTREQKLYIASLLSLITWDGAVASQIFINAFSVNFPKFTYDNLQVMMTDINTMNNNIHDVNEEALTDTVDFVYCSNWFWAYNSGLPVEDPQTTDKLCECVLAGHSAGGPICTCYLRQDSTDTLQACVTKCDVPNPTDASCEPELRNNRRALQEKRDTRFPKHPDLPKPHNHTVITITELEAIKDDIIKEINAIETCCEGNKVKAKQAKKDKGERMLLDTPDFDNRMKMVEGKLEALEGKLEAIEGHMKANVEANKAIKEANMALEGKLEAIEGHMKANVKANRVLDEANRALARKMDEIMQMMSK